MCPLPPAHPAHYAYAKLLPSLKALAAERSVSVMDLFGACRGANLRGCLQEDGIHPTVAECREVFEPALIAYSLTGTT